MSLASLTIKFWYSFGSENDQIWILITKIEKVTYKRNRNWMTGGSEFEGVMVMHILYIHPYHNCNGKLLVRIVDSL